MHKLYENVEKELKKIEENGLNSGNLDTAYKLLNMGKNIKKIEKLKEEEGHRMRHREDDYGARGRYRDGDYDAIIRGRYRDDRMPTKHKYERMYGHLDRIEDGIDDYSYGKDRYYDSGDSTRVEEGLEKLMYGICMMVETAMDFAETPEEKEIIHRHIQKIKAM
jgi:hypothetical protein